MSTGSQAAISPELKVSMAADYNQKMLNWIGKSHQIDTTLETQLLATLMRERDRNEKRLHERNAQSIRQRDNEGVWDPNFAV